MTGLPTLRSLRGPVKTLADQGLVSVANFSTVLLFARVLPVTDFGMVALVLTILFSATAIQTALVGQVHNVLGARREGSAFSTLTGHLLALQVVLVVSVAVTGLLVGTALLQVGSGTTGRVILDTTVVLIPWLFQDTVRRFLYTKRAMGNVLVNDIACYGLQLAGAVAMAFSMIPASFDTAMGVYFIACTSGSLVGVVQMKRLGARLDRKTWRADLSEAWQIGRYLSFGEVLALVGRNSTSWMLAAFMGLPALGAYKAVVQIANGLNPLAMAAGLYLPALASSRWEAGGAAAYKSWFAGLTFRLAAAFLGLLVALGLLGGPILDLVYEGRYDEFNVVLILQITLAARFLVFVHDTLFHGLVGAGESRAAVTDRLLQLGVLVAAGAPLVKGFGASGVAAWHVVSALVLTGYAIWRFRQLGPARRPIRDGGVPPDAIAFGAEGIIWAEPDGQSVRKQYTHPDRGPARARRDYSLLIRLHAAADRAPSGIRAPKPITFLAAEHSIVMERCDGTPLDAYLNERSPGAVEMRRIARKLNDGLDHVVQTLGEPYHDFSPQNLLWDETTDTLTLLDLGNDRLTRLPGLPTDPYTVSVGCFLGTTVYTGTRPGRRGRLGEIVRNAELFRALADDHRDESGSIDLPGMLRMAWSRFYEMGWAGSPARRAWYLTAGLAIGCFALLRSVVPLVLRPGRSVLHRNPARYEP